MGIRQSNCHNLTLWSAHIMFSSIQIQSSIQWCLFLIQAPLLKSHLSTGHSLTSLPSWGGEKRHILSERNIIILLKHSLAKSSELEFSSVEGNYYLMVIHSHTHAYYWSLACKTRCSIYKMICVWTQHYSNLNLELARHLLSQKRNCLHFAELLNGTILPL